MIDINLLPPFKFLPFKKIMGLLVYFMMMLLLHLHYQNLINEEKHILLLLQQQIEAMNREVQYAKPKTPHALQENGFHLFQLLHLIKQFTQTNHTGLYLTEVSTIKGGLKLVGQAENMPIVSRWVLQLTALHVKSTLKEMQHNEKNDYFPVKFSLWIK